MLSRRALDVRALEEKREPERERGKENIEGHLTLTTPSLSRSSLLIPLPPTKQPLLPLRRVHPTQPIQHVRDLHPVAGRHHRGTLQVGEFCFLFAFEAQSTTKKELAAAAAFQPRPRSHRTPFSLAHSLSPPRPPPNAKKNPTQTPTHTKNSSRSSGARPASATFNRRSTGRARPRSPRSSSRSACAASRASARARRPRAAATAASASSTPGSSGPSRTRAASRSS